MIQQIFGNGNTNINSKYLKKQFFENKSLCRWKTNELFAGNRNQNNVNCVYKNICV